MKLSLLIVLGILFIGCNDDSDSTNVNGGTTIVASCSDVGMTEIQEGDMLSNDEENTRVKIVHNENGKMICVMNGSAHISRR